MDIQHADSSRAAAFVSRKDQKIAFEFVNVDWTMTGALCRIDKGDNSLAPGCRTNIFHWIDASKRIGDMGEGQQPNRIVLQSLLQKSPIDGSLVSLDLDVLK